MLIASGGNQKVIEFYGDKETTFEEFSQQYLAPSNNAEAIGSTTVEVGLIAAALPSAIKEVKNLPQHLQSLSSFLSNSKNSIVNLFTRKVPEGDFAITGGSSTALKANLAENLGLPRSTQFPQHQAHHVIPSAVGKTHPVFQKIGINLDDASNGILLPSAKGNDISALPTHVGSHPQFNSFVTDKLDELDTNVSVEVLRGQVEELQQGLKKLLESGIPITGGKNSLGNDPKASVETLHKHFDRLNF